MTPDPVRHSHRPWNGDRLTLGKSRRPRAGGRVGILLADAAAAALDAQQAAAGALLDRAAGALEAAAGVARWLAAATRVCP